MRSNQPFLNRVSFRRRTPARHAATVTSNDTNINSNTKFVPNSTFAAMRSCIDTLSDTANITPTASVILSHEESSSGKIGFVQNLDF